MTAEHYRLRICAQSSPGVLRLSTNTLEKVLWDITVDPALEKDESRLGRYPLTPDEKGLLARMDVRSIADRGVSQMLIWMAWVATRGFEQAPEYMRRMNTPAGGGR